MVTIVAVHGTLDGAPSRSADGEGDAPAKWWEAGSAFHASVLEHLSDTAGDDIRWESFRWDVEHGGRNTPDARRDGARQLHERLVDLQEAGEKVILVGHSHGGNVIEGALRTSLGPRQLDLTNIETWATVGTPFLRSKRNSLLTQFGAAWTGLVLSTLVLLAPILELVRTPERMLDDAQAGGWTFWTPVALVVGLPALALGWRRLTDQNVSGRDVALRDAFGAGAVNLYSSRDEAIGALRGAIKEKVRVAPANALRPLEYLLAVILSVFLAAVVLFGVEGMRMGAQENLKSISATSAFGTLGMVSRDKISDDFDEEARTILEEEFKKAGDANQDLAAQNDAERAANKAIDALFAPVPDRGALSKILECPSVKPSWNSRLVEQDPTSCQLDIDGLPSYGKLEPTQQDRIPSSVELLSVVSRSEESYIEIVCPGRNGKAVCEFRAPIIPRDREFQRRWEQFIGKLRARLRRAYLSAYLSEAGNTEPDSAGDAAQLGQSANRVREEAYARITGAVAGVLAKADALTKEYLATESTQCRTYLLASEIDDRPATEVENGQESENQGPKSDDNQSDDNEEIFLLHRQGFAHCASGAVGSDGDKVDPRLTILPENWKIGVGHFNLVPPKFSYCAVAPFLFGVEALGLTLRGEDISPEADWTRDNQPSAFCPNLTGARDDLTNRSKTCERKLDGPFGWRLYEFAVSLRSEETTACRNTSSMAFQSSAAATASGLARGMANAGLLFPALFGALIILSRGLIALVFFVIDAPVRATLNRIIRSIIRGRAFGRAENDKHVRVADVSQTPHALNPRQRWRPLPDALDLELENLSDRALSGNASNIRRVIVNALNAGVLTAGGLDELTEHFDWASLIHSAYFRVEKFNAFLCLAIAEQSPSVVAKSSLRARLDYPELVGWLDRIAPDTHSRRVAASSNQGISATIKGAARMVAGMLGPRRNAGRRGDPH
ncbi:MAG: hypothetical protein GC152_10130 [Alphaproteobacteria bacterium]|nr:hypothetical protein [Alphaproteobacteria bacterium]